MTDDLSWLRSSLSQGDRAVEVAHLPDGGALVRRSDEPEVHLAFTADEWDAFVGGALNGEFDLEPGPVCANGCPSGYLGAHKISCRWAGALRLDGEPVLVLGESDGGVTVCVTFPDGTGHRHVPAGWVEREPASPGAVGIELCEPDEPGDRTLRTAPRRDETGRAGA